MRDDTVGKRLEPLVIMALEGPETCVQIISAIDPSASEAVAPKTTDETGRVRETSRPAFTTGAEFAFTVTSSLLVDPALSLSERRKT